MTTDGDACLAAPSQTMSNHEDALLAVVRGSDDCKANHIDGAFKEAFSPFPVYAALTMTQSDKLVLYYPAAVRKAWQISIPEGSGRILKFFL